uniref:Ankyrin repeat and SOCS box containing 2b n=1 Tax=Hippocampus comes TaxID=109280 RepID=A0A3Q2Z7F6_HIPCM
MVTKFSYYQYLAQFHHGRTKSSIDSNGDDNEVTSRQRGDGGVINVTENKDGWIPLHHAAFNGQHDCLRTLLKGIIPHLLCSADKRTLQEQTGLLLAVSSEHLSCVKCLLESGADPDISSKNKATPLYTGRVVPLFVKQFYHNRSSAACRLDNMDMVSLILSFGASVNQRCAQGWTALHEAVVFFSFGSLGADVNMQTCDGVTALHEASKNGHKEIVAVLLSKNADANKMATSGLLPLHVAAQHGHQEVVSLLVPVTSRTRLRHSAISPLHLAAEHDRPQVAAALLKAGVDVNATLAPARSARYADRRATALCFAVANGCAETAKVLLNAGANTGLDPVSPLLLAVQRGSTDIVSLLLQSGADVNAKIPSWATTFPAVVTLCVDNLPLLKCLLDNGCDALSCFSCPYGRGSHPEQSHMRNIGTFCQWISTPPVSQWAGPIVDLLLEHVAHVQLCGKLTQLLESRCEWAAVKRKSCKTHTRT